MEKFLRFFAYLASAVVMLGFVGFATDQLHSASKRTQDELAGITVATPSPNQEARRERSHTRVREAIDDANDVLLAPVAWIADGAHNRWVRRGVPSLLALLLYGLGIGMLARFPHGTPHRHEPRISPV
jgi:hypothetical protein